MTQEQVQTNTRPWTIVLPIRATKEEIGFMWKSLSAAMRLQPDEIILGVDAPLDPMIKVTAESIAFQEHFPESKLHIIEVEKTSDWKFQLAKIIWMCYNASYNDIIYSFDVDSIPTRNVLEGLKEIGTDNISVLSFTKKLRTKTIREKIRYRFYRLRVAESDYVFSGNYFIWRPAFFDTVNLEEYKNIRNGIDTYLTEKTLKDGKYKIVTKKSIGVVALTPQNEDYPWRQFQDGIWMYANRDKWFAEKQERRRLRQAGAIKQKPHMKLLSKAIHFKLWDYERDPEKLVRLKCWMYQYPYLLKGYKWAKNHIDNEIVTKAASMSQYDWSLTGADMIKTLNIPGLDISGTGST